MFDNAEELLADLKTVANSLDTYHAARVTDLRLQTSFMQLMSLVSFGHH